MAEKPMNGNDAERIGIQSQRITNLETVFSDFRRESSHQIGEMKTAIGTLTSKMDERFSALTTSLAERNRPQYQALAFALSVVIAVGALAYWPIRENAADMKGDIAMLAAETRRSFDLVGERFVTQKEMEWRTARGAEDRARQEAGLADLRANSVTRAEYGERNRARDQEVADLNRRFDELRADVGAVYGTRDVIVDMKKEIDNLRARLNDRFRAASP